MRRSILAMATAVAVLSAPLAPISAVPAPKASGCQQVELVWLTGSAGGSSALAATIEVLRNEVGEGETGVTRIGRAGPTLTASSLKQVRTQKLAARYFQGWQADAADAVGALTRMSRTCPDSMLAIGGFSRGAVSTRAAVRSLTKSPVVRRRVGLVLTVGDPLLRHRDRTIGDVVGFDLPERGAAGRALALPTWARSAGLSWCDQDPMCTTEGRVSDHDYRGRVPVSDELDVLAFDSQDKQTTLVGSPYTYRADDLRIVKASGLPAGMRVQGGAVTGTPRTVGTTRIRLTIRSSTVAPAVRATRTLKLDVVEPRAVAGTTLISRGYDGAPANDDSRTVTVSGDGNTVVFESQATNLVAGVSGADIPRIYAWHRATGTTELVAAPAGGDPRRLSVRGVSRDGNRILAEFTAFAARNTSLVLYDRLAGTSTTVADTDVERLNSMLTDDGEQVLFRTVSGTTTGIHRWTRATGTSEPVVMPSALAQRWTGGASADGRRLLIAYPAGVWDTGTQAFTATNGSATFGAWQGVESGEVSLDARLAAARGTGPAAGGGIGGDANGVVLDLPAGTARGSSFGNLAAAITPDAGWYADSSEGDLVLVRTSDGARYAAFEQAPDGDVISASITDDGTGVGFVDTASDLLPGTDRGVTNVYFWGR